MSATRFSLNRFSHLSCSTIKERRRFDPLLLILQSNCRILLSLVMHSEPFATYTANPNVCVCISNNACQWTDTIETRVQNCVLTQTHSESEQQLKFSRLKTMVTSEVWTVSIICIQQDFLKISFGLEPRCVKMMTCTSDLSVTCNIIG